MEFKIYEEKNFYYVIRFLIKLLQQCMRCWSIAVIYSLLLLLLAFFCYLLFMYLFIISFIEMHFACGNESAMEEVCLCTFFLWSFLLTLTRLEYKKKEVILLYVWNIFSYLNISFHFFSCFYFYCIKFVTRQFFVQQKKEGTEKNNSTHITSNSVECKTWTLKCLIRELT